MASLICEPLPDRRERAKRQQLFLEGWGARFPACSAEPQPGAAHVWLLHHRGQKKKINQLTGSRHQPSVNEPQPLR